MQAKGLRDDTTCIVIDVYPQEKQSTAVTTQKKPVKGRLKSIFRKKSSESSSYVDKQYQEPDMVQELYEEGSAMLSERSGFVTCFLNVGILLFSYISLDMRHPCPRCRLETKYPLCNMFKLFICAVCQVEIKPGEGISIYVGVSKPGRLRPWDGPFLCPSCQEKREAMEGKRASGICFVNASPLLYPSIPLMPVHNLILRFDILLSDRLSSGSD